jgi:hypothetical protein
MKKGGNGHGTFSKPSSYTGIGDPFKVAAQTMLRKEDRAHQIEIGNEKAFRPAKHVRRDLYKADFEHMKDYENLQKNYRDPEQNNEVIIAPRNIQTNPPKLGKTGKNTSFAGIIPYMEDDYNIPKKLATEARLHG